MKSILKSKHQEMKEKNKILAVIDTNVLVSSLFSKDGQSNPALVISSILNEKIIPLYNSEIIEEYRDVLSRDKFRFPSYIVDNLVSVFEHFGIDTARTNVSDEVFPDSDDIVFYEVKMSEDEAFLVTGNLRHFPKNPLVVTPAQMIDILKEHNLL